MDSTRVAAIDLGATSGRVVAFDLGDDGRIDADLVTRFPNGPTALNDRLVWDIPALYRSAMDGVAQAHLQQPVASVGIDSWAIDYGVTDAEGNLIGEVYAYRDAQHEKGFAVVDEHVSWPQQYAIAGIQRLPFNTIYQLAADHGSARLLEGSHVLLVPDLIAMWLTGNAATELTNASHTAMVDALSQQWSAPLVAACGVRPELLSRIERPGSVRGLIRTDQARDVPLITVGSHDTASSFAAVPVEPGHSAAIVSLGTWALVGTHIDTPILTDEAREANFTNEIAIDGSIRFLRNVTGMWILEELRRELSSTQGRDVTIPEMLAEAQDAPAFRTVINPDDALFAPPGAMIGRIQGACSGPSPVSTGELTRCVLESMVARIVDRIDLCARIVGTDFTVLHVVGGGAHNAFIVQWLADALGLPVVAGPAEATAYGNALVQWMSLGVIADQVEGRRLIRNLPEVHVVEPSKAREGWPDFIARQREWAKTDRT